MDAYITQPYLLDGYMNMALPTPGLTKNTGFCS